MSQKSKNKEARMQRFNSLHLSYISWQFDTSQKTNNDSYIIYCQQHGTDKVLEYFPKSDRILIRDKNKWYHGGLKLLYIILNIKNPETHGEGIIYDFFRKG